ncbi:hypothetical protein D5F01_LYC20723 [Larimichthys crocea]|uniref:Ig-like domain-containing protein n=1 Tax=Larimichthys crocea TaxID=215358 RepID=A0A6G0HRM8_LARCR|nr:hypothetical protein D5F01_LYC20723 [Larimichthys crocea]
MVHRSACLLLLTCLAGFSATETGQSGTVEESSYGPSSVQISGVDIVSVGIIYGFQCSANCYPTCQFTWIWGNVTSQGQDLSLQLEELQPAQNLTCTAVNNITGVSVTVQKTLEITAGPSNISISGQALLIPGIASNFTCSADCSPSCNYSWTVDLDGKPFSTVQGNTISVIPPSTATSESLICHATNTISNLYISKTLILSVANGPSSVVISGVDTMTVGIIYGFQCSANCYPICQFTWIWGNVTSQGQDLSLQLEELQPAQNLTCTAVNNITGVSVTVQKTLEITAGPSNIHISGQAFLTPGVASNFTCSADCSPSCNYSWTVDLYGKPFSTAQGNTISVIPPSTATSESLICHATNTISNLYISRTLILSVANGPSSVVISGVDTMTVGIIYGFQCSANCYPICQFTWIWDGPSSVVISGVDTMTVGIIYGFQCSANCYPICQFTWIWGNVTSQGQDLSLQLEELQPAQNLTCTAVNNITGVSVTVQKTLEITAGPSNIHISGQAFLTPGVASNFTCSADCSPSCNYSWTVDLYGKPFSTVQGNTISVIPPSTATSESLICHATNTISNLYISKSLVLWVASLSNAVINGDSRVTMGKQYSYICSATCIPSCDFTWKFMGRIYQGDQIQLPIMHQGNELLTCEVMNTLSNTTITATVNLTIIDPFEVHPSSQDLPIAGEPFSLQCVGHQDTASITWLKNNHPMAASEQVHFSPDNNSVNFSPLLREDGGLYQCLVLEGGNSSKLVSRESGTPIQSVGYLLQVNYGPDKVLIVKPKKGPVGKEMFALPASVTQLQCLTDCFPACSISWFYHGTFLSTNATIFFTPGTPPNKAALNCVAFNSVTKKNKTAETTVVVPDGPKNVIISGPDSLEIGITTSFTCTAECTPSCNFTWILYGKTMTSDEIDITMNPHISKESISCLAENTITGKTVMVNGTLSVSDPHWCGC